MTQRMNEKQPIGNELDSQPSDPERRGFLLASSACAALGWLGLPRAAESTIVDLGLPRRTICGYAWPWTARPGEKIEFKVSTYAPGRYQAELVRLICADAMTEDGRHFKEEPTDAPFARTYPGRNQRTYLGSFVEIANTAVLDGEASFTLVASLFPTKVVTGSELAASAFSVGVEESRRAIQHVIARWHEASKTGWSLAIDEDDRPAFYVGDGSGSVDKIVLTEPLVLRRWVRLSVSYDHSMRQVSLAQEPVYQGDGDRAARRADRTQGLVRRIVQDGPLRFGAAVGGPSNTKLMSAAGGFNGKLDTVRMMAGVLSADAIKALFVAAQPREHAERALGWWDFAQGIGTTRVHDVSGHGLDGTTVNLPERAVMGVNWNGTKFDWRDAPGQYDAIYFHDDDLIDAEWKTDFDYTVPGTLRSGMYAVKLRHAKSEAYVPFYVAPARSAPKPKLAFVVPTMTYLAYANTIGVSHYTRKVLTTGPNGEQKIEEEEWMPICKEEKAALQFADEHGPRLGLGVYRWHSDGTPVHHAPMRIPNISNEPKAINRQTTADTDIIEWLEHDGVDYHVITDELLHQEGLALLQGYAAVVTGSHTEYHTWEMFRAYMQYLNEGGRLISIGGNGFHNRIAFHREIPGVIECRKKMGGTPGGLDYHFEVFGEFDGLPHGRFKELGSPPNTLHGLGTTGLHAFTGGTYYQLLPAARDPRARFIFEGVSGNTFGNFGKVGGGAASEELDHADLTEGTPPHALIVARSGPMVWPMVSDDGLTEPKYRLNFDPRADIVFFETPNGGAVFSVGSMGWRGALSHNAFNNNVAQITRNVLKRFTDSVPFSYPG